MRFKDGSGFRTIKTKQFLSLDFSVCLSVSLSSLVLFSSIANEFPPTVKEWGRRQSWSHGQVILI